MATEATEQILASSVDTAGVSTVTATRTVANPRSGTIYNPATLAAAPPVWFHRLQDGRYLALFRNRWVDATGVYHDGPQMFSDYTEDLTPVRGYIAPTTGAIDGPYPMTSYLTGNLRLNAAVSRGDYLFTLGTLDGIAWVQHWRISDRGVLSLVGEEATPLGYDLGLYADRNYLQVFGADEDGNLARVRKNWGRIGNNVDAQMQWEYEGLKGWLTDASLHTPMLPHLPADGPCSMATFRDRTYLVITEHSGGAYSAEVYTQRAVDQTWTRLGDTVIPLGDDADYLGGSAYLQPQLVGNKDLLPDGASTGIPYVTSVRVVIGGDQAILTEWDLLTV